LPTYKLNCFLLERQDVEAVSRAQKEGLKAEHRGDVHYLAFLNLMLVVPSPAMQPSRTSPGHAYDVVGR
jgi:hypothetical protein